MKKVFLILVSLMLSSMFSFAQEFNCSVLINSEKVDGTNKNLYKELESALNDFMNNQRWTDAVFQKEEKIDLSITLHLENGSDANGGKQFGTLDVSASRPVFNTSYMSPLFHYQDRQFQFNYRSGDRIEFSDGDFDASQNLMAVLGFYVYVVLGVEFDSFSPLGGSAFFEKAESISSSARGTEDPGWKALSSDDNRYTLISAYTDPNLANIHNVYYEYHRLGFDVMADDVNKGKAKILEQMTYLREMQRAKPFALPLQIFVSTKFDELYNLYRLDDQKTRDEVYNAIAAIAPNMKDIDKLQKGN